MVVLCHTKEDAHIAKSTLETALQKRGLKLSEAKTSIKHIADGFDFLGFTLSLKAKDGINPKTAIVKDSDGSYRYDFYKVGLYVNPSKKSIKSFMNRLKETFKKYRGKSCLDLIKAINPMIRGYAESKRYWHSNRTFRDLDHYIFNLQWHWIHRTHPNKPVYWKKSRYFKHMRWMYINNRWVFHAPETDTFMLQFKWFPIQTYILAKMDSNPDDKLCKDSYNSLFRMRQQFRKFSIFNALDRELAKRQDSICPVCDQPLYENNEPVHRHHIVPTSKGGSNKLSNLILLHYPCHYQIHYSNDKDNWVNILSAHKQRPQSLPPPF